MIKISIIIALGLGIIIAYLVNEYQIAKINARSHILRLVNDAIYDYRIYCIEHNVVPYVTYDDVGDIKYLLKCSNKNFKKHILPEEKHLIIAPFINWESDAE